LAVGNFLLLRSEQPELKEGDEWRKTLQAD
jgi:hypothetical protein